MATVPSPRPSEDLFTLTVDRAKAWGAALTSYVGGLAALIGGWFALKNLFPEWRPELVLGVASIPLVLALLTVTLPAWLARRRDQKLIAEGIGGQLEDPGFFRVRPYIAAERERYDRPDNAHKEILNWLREAASPVLYLTGRSGTGKSSLLNAWVLPALGEDDPPCQTLIVRSYHDPLKELVDSLKKPGNIWRQPPIDLPDDPRAMLERACDYLQPKRKLLIVLDQFEEFVILHERAEQKPLEQFVGTLIDQPVVGLTFLLVLRSDYIGALGELGLPTLRQQDNWQEVSPFTQRVAVDILDRSGLRLGDELKRRVLEEAAEIEENPGLIRPITLNMFGLILSRFTGELPQGFEAGRLISGYLRDALAEPGIRDHARKIVQQMLVSDTGTKRPLSEPDLAAATKLDPSLIRGCLLNLGNRGLVRPIDEVNQVWEISHDFVARVFNQIVGKWRTSVWRTLRPWIAPTALALWVAVVFAGAPLYQNYFKENPLEVLAAMSINVIGEPGKGYRIDFPDIEDIDEQE